MLKDGDFVWKKGDVAKGFINNLNFKLKNNSGGFKLSLNHDKVTKFCKYLTLNYAY